MLKMENTPFNELFIYSSDTWNNTLMKLDELTANISAYLDCFETDKFEPVSSGKNHGKKCFQKHIFNPKSKSLMSRIWIGKAWSAAYRNQSAVGRSCLPGFNSRYFAHFVIQCPVQFFPAITSSSILDMLKLPRFVSYKIRINADKVDSTKRLEDRLNM